MVEGISLAIILSNMVGAPLSALAAAALAVASSLFVALIRHRDLLKLSIEAEGFAVPKTLTALVVVDAVHLIIEKGEVIAAMDLEAEAPKPTEQIILPEKRKTINPWPRVQLLSFPFGPLFF